MIYIRMVMDTLLERNKRTSFFLIVTIIFVIVINIVSSCYWYYPTSEFNKDLKIEISALTGIDTSSLEYVNQYNEWMTSLTSEYFDIYEFNYTGDEKLKYIELTPEDSLVLFHKKSSDTKDISDSLMNAFKNGTAGALYSVSNCVKGISIIHTPQKIWLYVWQI